MPTIDQSVFREPGYLRHNKARLDHLASLGLFLNGRSVLMLGSGIGDHAQFFLDRGCNVTVTDGRPENVEFMRREHPDWDVRVLDVESAGHFRLPAQREIVHAYGILYHTEYPLSVLTNIASLKPDLLLLETCVSPKDTFKKPEELTDPRCSIRGIGSRPTRNEIWNHLKKLFPFVYSCRTQPNHEEFILDWSKPQTGECRAVFIASSTELNNPLLSSELVTKHSPNP